MRILIVDDERLVRVTFRMMLEELVQEYLVVDEASTGMQMEKLLMQNTYDIVFLDINLTGEDGLSALESVYMRYPQIVWCIITGYRSFDYAMRALKLGVAEYILKPPDTEELAHFLENAQKRILNARRRRHEELEHAIRNWSMVGEYGDYALGEKTGTLYMFRVDGVDEETIHWWNTQIYHEMERFYFERDLDFAMLFAPNGELCLVIQNAADPQFSRFFHTRVPLSEEHVFVSGLYMRITDLSLLRKNMKYLSALTPLCLYQRNGEIVPVQYWEKDPEFTEKRYFSGCLDRLMISYQIRNAEEFYQIVRELRQKYVSSSGQDLIPAVLLSHLSVTWEEELAVSGIQDLLNRLCELREKEKVSVGGENMISHVKHYVQEHYMEDVSLTRVSELCNITPAYLSRIFRGTGQKFIDYVTEVRLERAREFLYTGQYSVKEVASMVGYVSEKHFSRTFKKRYGVSPSQVYEEGTNESAKDETSFEKDSTRQEIT